VQLHHHPSAEGCVVLGPADPLGQLPTRPRPHRELVAVEGHEHWVKAGGGRPARVLMGGLDRPLADRFRVARRHAQAVAGEGLAQRRPSGPKLLCGGIDTAQPLRERKGALGLGAVGEQAAGLAAQRVAIVPAARLRSALDSGRVLSQANTEQYAHHADAAGADSPCLEGAPQQAARVA
jgi:hypothetical protein